MCHYSNYYGGLGYCHGGFGGLGFLTVAVDAVLRRLGYGSGFGGYGWLCFGSFNLAAGPPSTVL